MTRRPDRSERAHELRRVRHPTFMVIGGQRCGTTWLHRMLAPHPDVFVPPGKEPDYFNRRVLKVDYDDFLERSYSKAPPRPHRGDMSVNYSMMPRAVVAELHRLHPDLKLVMILRDPVERSWSQLKLVHDLMSRTWTRSPLHRWRRRPLDAMTEARLHREIAHPRVVRRSDYARIIDTWTGVFGPAAMHIEIHDDLQREPRRVVERILRHLGADPGAWPVPPDIDTPIFGSGATVDMPPSIRAWLAQRWIEPTIELDRRLDGRLGRWVSEMEHARRDERVFRPMLPHRLAIASDRIAYAVFEGMRWTRVRRRLRRIPRPN